MTLDQRLAAQLAELRARDLYRSRRALSGAQGVEIVVDGTPCLNFCSNDYLGLAGDPRVAAAARTALAGDVGVGVGSGASALVCGYHEEHRALEEELAAHVGRPRALLFSSGWAANLGTLRALLGKSDSLIADELNHASLIDGGRLAGAEYLRVAHLDLAGYQRALENAKGQTRLLAVDSVFSMDGDCAPLPQLAALCAQHRASLMVDDSHGLGVLGKCGRGAVCAAGLDLDAAPIYMAGLGKALGCAGAFVAGSENLIEFLIQRARSWIFSTAPPPALAAAARAALKIVQQEPQRQAQLQENLRRFRDGARQLGIPLTESLTPIQPLILGAEARTLQVSRALFERGYWVSAIRPPTVPAGTARLRITMSAQHEATQIDGLLDALASALREAP